MSCWVVPAIAAEMWGVSVAQVLARVAEGSLATRVENGWTFVDIAPDSPTFVGGAPRIKPPTYTIITAEEQAALAAPAAEELLAPAAQAHEEETTDEHSADISWRQWHRVRAEVGRTRRRPAAAASASKAA